MLTFPQFYATPSTPALCIELSVAFYLLFVSFIMDTRDLRSKVVFNMLPMTLALFLSLVAFKIL